MLSAAVQSFRSSALRHERGHSGSASFAARPWRALHACAPLRTAAAVALAPLATGAAGTLVPDAALVTVAALRRSHLRIQRRPPDSVERAALQMPRTTAARADQPDADGFSACALPFGTRAITHMASVLAVGQRSCWAGICGKLIYSPLHFTLDRGASIELAT